MTIYQDNIEEDEEEPEELPKESFLDEATEVDSDEDEVEEFVVDDRLPSPEEVRATVNLQLKKANRKSSWFSDFRKLSTCCLLSILVVMLVVFFVVFFGFPELWKDAEEMSSHLDDSNGSSNAAETTPAPSPPPSPLEVKLRTYVALRGGLEFGDHDSYQWQALQFMLRQEDFYRNMLTANLQQIYAIICIYYATEAEGSKNFKHKWLDENNKKECSWSGIECNKDLKIVKLDLSTCGLGGQLPEELVLLKHLRDLNIENNPSLTGEIPAFLGNMNLESLKLNDCGFYGDLPFSICSELERNPMFNLDLDCSRIVCQPSCCGFCY